MKNCTGTLCPMQYGKVDPATCQAVDYCPQATPPKTNADRIRSMTDEELAEWIFRNQMYLFKSICNEIGYTEYDEKKMEHWDNILSWLEQEVK